MAASPREPKPGSYDWWCLPARREQGRCCGFPARRDEHSLAWYQWSYQNQPPRALDGPTDVESITVGFFACGKNHLNGFGPRVPQSHPDVRTFKEDYVITDHWMFRDVAHMMGDARERGPPRAVPPERAVAVWTFDCGDLPHCGEGKHIGKNPAILRRVYDSRAFRTFIVAKMKRFVDWVRYKGRS